MFTVQAYTYLHTESPSKYNTLKEAKKAAKVIVETNLMNIVDSYSMVWDEKNEKMLAYFGSSHFQKVNFGN